MKFIGSYDIKEKQASFNCNNENCKDLLKELVFIVSLAAVCTPYDNIGNIVDEVWKDFDKMDNTPRETTKIQKLEIQLFDQDLKIKELTSNIETLKIRLGACMTVMNQLSNIPEVSHVVHSILLKNTQNQVLETSDESEDMLINQEETVMTGNTEGIVSETSEDDNAAEIQEVILETPLETRMNDELEVQNMLQDTPKVGAVSDEIHASQDEVSEKENSRSTLVLRHDQGNITRYLNDAAKFQQSEVDEHTSKTNESSQIEKSSKKRRVEAVNSSESIAGNRTKASSKLSSNELARKEYTDIHGFFRDSSEAVKLGLASVPGCVVNLELPEKRYSTTRLELYSQWMWQSNMFKLNSDAKCSVLETKEFQQWWNQKIDEHHTNGSLVLKVRSELRSKLEMEKQPVGETTKCLLDSLFSNPLFNFLMIFDLVKVFSNYNSTTKRRKLKKLFTHVQVFLQGNGMQDLHPHEGWCEMDAVRVGTLAIAQNVLLPFEELKEKIKIAFESDLPIPAMN